jgi:glycosyltransferase involved in cell wall biosynthesis
VAVCRQMVVALEEGGFRTTYVNVSEGARGGRFAAAAEAWNAGRSSSRMGPVDVAISNGPIGIGVRGATSVHMYHGTYVGQAAAIRSAISRRGAWRMRVFDGGQLEQRAGRGKVCLANSDRTAAEVAGHFGFQCRVVWCPVEVDEFRPGNLDTALMARIGVARGRPVALFVGADRPMKGPVTAARVARRLRDLTWIVVGRPSAGLDFGTGRVIWLDSVSRSDMAPLLRSVDVLLAPGPYEPFGILAAEALSSGTPVVTGPSGLADLVLHDHGRRFLVPDPEDVTAFVRATEAVIEERTSVEVALREVRRLIGEWLAPSVWRERFLTESGLS